jgi:GAF domain-containing protein
VLAIQAKRPNSRNLPGISLFALISKGTVNSGFMAETLLYTATGSRETIFDEIVPQIESLVAGESDLIANLANIAAVLKEAFGFFWVGFYLEKDGELVLGPFQGPLACTRIAFDQGVCGRAFSSVETVVVPDVDQFPGHIACSSLARSEIVVPILNAAGTAVGVLDVDSDSLNDFSETDADGLGRIAGVIRGII